jgi:hypothetical protein
MADEFKVMSLGMECASGVKINEFCRAGFNESYSNIESLSKYLDSFEKLTFYQAILK